MHSVDVEPEPQEVLLELGFLVTEGRRPTTASPKGFEEGPHCLKHLQKGPRNHVCTAQNHLCMREASFRKHVDLLWRNNVPLCIEVLLCSTCPCGREKTLTSEISPLPDPTNILLEQWTITSLAKRIGGIGGAIGADASAAGRATGMGITNGKSILHAVRSFLHFSQLSAWLALSKGESPKNIMYRVAIPGENFLSKFVQNQSPEDHEFPMVQFKSHVMKVSVKSLPRLGSVPVVSCSNLICTTTLIKRSQSPPIGEIIRGDSPRPQMSSGRYNFRLNTPTGNNRVKQKQLRKGQRNNERKMDYLLMRDDGGPQETSTSSSQESAGSFSEGGGVDDNKFLSIQDDELKLSSLSLSTIVPRTRPIPTLSEKIDFLKSLDTAATRLFHRKTGLPLTSSPAPLRKGQDRFDFDSSLVSTSRITSRFRRGCHPPRFSEATRALLGPFEESVLNGRIEPVSTVQGFTAEIGASGSFCPRHIHLPVTVFFYTFCDNDKISTPYLAHVDLGEQGYCVPRKGTVQVTLFNPLRTVIKMFVVQFNLENMPNNSQTFLRQRTYFMPLGESDPNNGGRQHPNAQKWLRYLIHLRFASNHSGQIFLHTDIRMIIFRKTDADTATGFVDVQSPHELRSFTYAPSNPSFSPRIINSSQSSLNAHHSQECYEPEEKEEPVTCSSSSSSSSMNRIKKDNKLFQKTSKFLPRKIIFDEDDDNEEQELYGKEYEYEFEPCNSNHSDIEIIV